MPWFHLALEAVVLLAFWLCLGASQRDPATPGRLTFIGLALSVAAWSLGTIAEMRELLDPQQGDRITYLGAMALPAMWAGLATQSAGTDLARRVPWLPMALLMPQLPLYALLYAGPWGAVFLSYAADGSAVPGPLWWVSAVYAWLCSLAGTTIFIATAIRWRQPGQWVRRLVLGIASLAPIGSNIAFIASGMSWSPDPTPLLLGAALLALRSAVFSGGILQALPISQHDLIHQFPLGVILTDRLGTVLEVNPAAERSLSVVEEKALGRTLAAVLGRSNADARIDICPILSRDHEVGQIVLIDRMAKG